MTDPTITPPPELRQQWREQAPRYRDGGVGREHWLIERTAQWVYEQCGEVNEAELQQARDQELEATLAEVSFLAHQALAARVRAARRPKPPTRAEIALEQYDRCVSILEEKGYSPAGCIRDALVRLKQLEDSDD
jgi:hypothetical protein